MTGSDEKIFECYLASQFIKRNFYIIVRYSIFIYSIDEMCNLFLNAY